MSRFLVSVVGSVILLSSHAFSAAPSIPYASVHPLQDSTGKNICTASSINATKHYWLTARHCVYVSLPVADTSIDILNLPYMADEQVSLIMEDESDDLAIVSSELSAPALRLAPHAPQLGDRTVLYGFAFGLQNAMLFQGYVSCLDCDLDRDGDAPEDAQTHYMTFDMSAAGGDSGSPVFNAAGRVISVLQIGFGQGSSSISGGVRYWELLRSTIDYWER